MKVLHVIPSISLLDGGPSIAVQKTARALAAVGVEVTLATTNADGHSKLDVPLGVPVRQDGYTIYYFNCTLKEYTFSFGITPWLLRHIREYDLVHIHAVFSYTSTISGLFANFLHVPYIVRPAGILQSWGVKVRRTLAKQFHYRLFERWILNRAAFVQAMTIAEANEYAALNLKAPIHILPHGLEATVDANNLSNVELPALPGNALPYLFIGRFHPVKGLDLLLPAFAEALRKEPRLVLFLAGDGDETYKAWMHKTIQELGIELHVHWLGFLRDDKKQKVIAASTVVVVPSYTENFGMVVIEALACGVPVIVTESVGLASEIAAADAGLVIPCDSAALTQAILAMAHTPERRAEMSRNATALIENKFLLKQVTDNLITYYQDAITKSQQ